MYVIPVLNIRFYTWREQQSVMTHFGVVAQPKLLEVKLLTQRETIKARQREKLCIRPVAWDLYEVHKSLPSHRCHWL